MKADRGLTIERMVELGRVSRAGFYRFDADGRAWTDADMDLRDAIQRIALEWPSYGRPRITAELRRRGWTVNPKRVYRIMREDNLLCVRKRKFVVTTDSNHGRKVYPNLARRHGADRYQPALGGRHHLHSAGDGVRLSGGDPGRLLAARDRLGAGPDAGRRTDHSGTAHGIGAPRSPSPGLVHHSDRGAQYASPTTRTC